MPAHFFVDPDLDLWYVVGSGRATGTEYVECLKASVRDPHFHLDIDLLLDLQPITDLDVSLGEMKAIYQADKALFGGAPQHYRAAVLTRNLTDRTLTQLYAAMVKSSGVQIAPFDDLRDALQWLSRGPAEERLRALRRDLLAVETH